MTIEQNEANLSKLLEQLKFHVHNSNLRDKLVEFVKKQGNLLKSTPASSRHHHAELGGLLRHYVEVIQLGIEFLQTMQQFMGSDLTADAKAQQCEDLVVAVLVHDLHKMCDMFGRKFYEPNMIKAGRTADAGLKQSTAKPYMRNPKCFDLRNHLPMVGNGKADGVVLTNAVAEFLDRNRDDIREGELSLFLFNALDPVIYLLLNDQVKYAVRYHDGAYSTSSFELAGKESPVMLALHHADMVSSRADRWRKPPTPEE